MYNKVSRLLGILRIEVSPKKMYLFVPPLFSFSGIEIGKVVIQRVGNDDLHCTYVSLNGRFSSGTPVRVFASINYGNESLEVHDSASIWVEDVTTSRFKVCLLQGGRGSVVNATIDWFAFQGSQSGVHHGETSFSLFTTGTKCNRVAFPQVRLCPLFFFFFLSRHTWVWQWSLY